MKLPLNCSVDYLSDFLTAEEAGELYDTLIDEYKLDEERLILNVGDQIIETDSFRILFATKAIIEQNSHHHSVQGKAFEWTGLMQELRDKVEKFIGKKYELAMCLYYPDGNHFAPYHFDQQTSGYKTILPSISLGTVRKFSFKEIGAEEVYSFNLDNGSLLVMGDYCQNRYVHSLPKDGDCKKGRINITFREPDFK